MEGLLITARAVHFASVISLNGVLAFECLVAAPAFRAAGASEAATAALRRRLRFLAWPSLAFALVSGAAWLVAVAATISGEPLAAVLSQGTLRVVLIDTRFGEDWLLRLACAVVIAALLAARRESLRRVDPPTRWVGLILATLLLASLAWAGHGAATAGAAGNLHLAGDVLHLAAAGTWLGTLLPLALLLGEAHRGGEACWQTVARAATRRFSVVATVSVVALLAGGMVNTWFLAGTVPALVGTEYGHLLLSKISLFVAMLVVASVNLLQLTPRLTGAAASQATGQLRRNALIEATLGYAVVAIVALLGILPPGLQTQPGWPFPFRFDFAALSIGAGIAVAILAALIFVCCVGAVAAAAAGRYRTTAGLAAGLALCSAAAWAPLRGAVELAYPTSFYAPAQPYAANSVVRGASIYAADCAACHGTSGKGDGPAAAGLPIQPANLTEAHLFAHTPGELFWWVSHGRANGAMPGFADVLKPSRRWDVINFIRARAAGVQSGAVGSTLTTEATAPVPDFAFEVGGTQTTLRQMLERGPLLLVLYEPPAPVARLEELAAGQPRLAAAGLRVVAVKLGDGSDGDEAAPAVVVHVSRKVDKSLALFRAPGSSESELMLDRSGNVRLRWTASNLAPPDRLVAEAERVARAPLPHRAMPVTSTN
jgi:putative copper resistance protein D